MAVKDIRLEQVTRFSQKGSALAGTMQARAIGLELRVDIESDEPPERVRQLVKMGKQTCYTHQAVMDAMPIHTFVRLNGEDLQPD